MSAMREGREPFVRYMLCARRLQKEGGKSKPSEFESVTRHPGFCPLA